MMPAFHARVRKAISECVRKQRDTGLDIVNDGEWSKPDYSTYVKNRFTGFEGEPTPTDTSRDMLDFPEYAPYRRTSLQQLTRPMCNGPIAWKDFDAVQRDIDNLKAAAGNAEEVFMTAVSPGQVARFQGNSYYKSDEEYLGARRRPQRRVQGDHRRWLHATARLPGPGIRLEWAVPVTDARGVSQGRRPASRSAQHGDQRHPARAYAPASLLGHYEGPHHHDIPLREIIEPVLQARPAAVSFEGANPRHEHEWNVFEDVQLPDGNASSRV